MHAFARVQCFCVGVLNLFGLEASIVPLCQLAMALRLARECWALPAEDSGGIVPASED